MLPAFLLILSFAYYLVYELPSTWHSWQKPKSIWTLRFGTSLLPSPQRLPPILNITHLLSLLHQPPPLLTDSLQAFVISHWSTWSTLLRRGTILEQEDKFKKKNEMECNLNLIFVLLLVSLSPKFVGFDLKDITVLFPFTYSYPLHKISGLFRV